MALTPWLEEVLTAEAADQLGSCRPITLVIEPAGAMYLISQIQLAGRHPENDGPGRAYARMVVDGLRDQLAAPGTAVYRLIELGWDPDNDQR